jgi:hypothetical protein
MPTAAEQTEIVDATDEEVDAVIVEFGGVIGRRSGRCSTT